MSKREELKRAAYVIGLVHGARRTRALVNRRLGRARGKAQSELRALLQAIDALIAQPGMRKHKTPKGNESDGS